MCLNHWILPVNVVPGPHPRCPKSVVWSTGQDIYGFLFVCFFLNQASKEFGLSISPGLRAVWWVFEMGMAKVFFFSWNHCWVKWVCHRYPGPCHIASNFTLALTMACLSFIWLSKWTGFQGGKKPANPFCELRCPPSADTTESATPVGIKRLELAFLKNNFRHSRQLLVQHFSPSLSLTISFICQRPSVKSK